MKSPIDKIGRRKFLGTVAAGMVAAKTARAAGGPGSATFTILHTNDLHSNLIGVGPASEYTTDSLNDDETLGGMERIASLIRSRRRMREAEGPVLVLDIGDFTIGTPFGGAFQETGSELQCLAMAGFDATTLGNHEFDGGPDFLAKGIAAAQKAGNVPAILASNINLDAEDPGLQGLRELSSAGVILSHKIIERGGLRFGLFGVMGPDAIQFTINPGAVTFPDWIAASRETCNRLRAEGVDVIVCMSHGGVREPEQGPITEGDDVDLAKAVPEIDVIVGAHTHTFMSSPVIVDGTPIVQAGCYGQAVGELVVRLEGSGPQVASYNLHAVDDSILGDPRLAEEISVFKSTTSDIVFRPRGFQIDEALAVIDQDWPNTFFDLERSRPIGNLAADAIRFATGADVALHAAGMIRAGLPKGSAGVQTAYDAFLLAPIGIGVEDQSAGGSLLVAYLTGHEIKNSLEFLLVGNPNLPGQYFPRVSGIRFEYDESRENLDAVTKIELGNFDEGYREIDTSPGATDIYSVSCNLYFGLILNSIPTATNGALSLIPKKKDGTPLESRVDALPDTQSGPYILPPKGSIDEEEVVSESGPLPSMEVKEWEAVMRYLRSLPTKNAQGITELALDERATEDRSRRTG